MVRKHRGQIQREVYFRLAFYNYDRFPQLKPQKIDLIEKWLKNDVQSSLMSNAEHLTWKQGWVTIEHIEAEDCPYGSPEGHRHEYLKKDPLNLVEFKTYGYVVKKPGQKNRNPYSETVYRLKRDKHSRNKLRRLMLDYPSFWRSDYYQELYDAEEAAKERARLHVRACLRDKDVLGSYSEANKGQLQLLLTHLDIVRKEIEAELRDAKVVPDHEFRKVVKKEREKVNWTRLSQAPSVTGQSGYNSQQSHAVGASKSGSWTGLNN